MRARVGLAYILLGVVACVAVGCVYKQKIPAEDVHTVYLVEGRAGTLSGMYAPAFLTYDAGKRYNRIGSPRVRLKGEKAKGIYVDTDRPEVFEMRKAFETDRGRYLNLIYRVHFPGIPYSLFPFHVTAGKNVGLMVIVTLDEAEQPVLVTTVHTCGCYVAVLPTAFLPPDAYPKEMKDAPLKAYGEALPWPLDYSAVEKPRLLVHLRPAVHRVMHLEVVDERELRQGAEYAAISVSLAAMHSLERLPVDGESTSLYSQKWPLRGHVKGAVKPFESLFLGLVSLDLFVGADKAYGDREQSGTRFYTSLKAWNRKKSDMWEFTRFLQFMGWRL